MHEIISSGNQARFHYHILPREKGNDNSYAENLECVDHYYYYFKFKTRSRLNEMQWDNKKLYHTFLFRWDKLSLSVAYSISNIAQPLRSIGSPNKMNRNGLNEACNDSLNICGHGWCFQNKQMAIPASHCRYRIWTSRLTDTDTVHKDAAHSLTWVGGDESSAYTTMDSFFTHCLFRCCLFCCFLLIFFFSSHHLLYWVGTGERAL